MEEEEEKDNDNYERITVEFKLYLLVLGFSSEKLRLLDK